MDEKRMAIESDIAGLKQILASSDYKALKYEGQISEEDYAEIRDQRQSLRDKINELEAELATIGESEETADAE